MNITFLKWANMSGLFKHISDIRPIAPMSTPYMKKKTLFIFYKLKNKYFGKKIWVNFVLFWRQK